MAQVHLDSRWFPLILQRWPDDVTNTDLDAFFNAIDEIARRAQRQQVYYAVVVTGRATDLDMTQRRRIARWVRGMPRELRDRSGGSFLVLTSAMQRGAVNALRYILPDLHDVHVFATIDEAVKGALAMLKARNAGVSPTFEEIVRAIGTAPP